jgi:hypothetical protein
MPGMFFGFGAGMAGCEDGGVQESGAFLNNLKWRVNMHKGFKSERG